MPKFNVGDMVIAITNSMGAYKPGDLFVVAGVLATRSGSEIIEINPGNIIADASDFISSPALTTTAQTTQSQPASPSAQPLPAIAAGAIVEALTDGHSYAGNFYAKGGKFTVISVGYYPRTFTVHAFDLVGLGACEAKDFALAAITSQATQSQSTPNTLGGSISTVKSHATISTQLNFWQNAVQDALIPLAPPPCLPSCECGAQACKSQMHSSWCPLYVS